MTQRQKMLGILGLFLVLYTINFFCVGKIDAFAILIYFVGLGVFAGWLVWEGRRAGFLNTLLGKKPQ
jgi:hypothetical protein